jgi:hypothetical protein
MAASSEDATAALRALKAAWKTAAPTRQDFGAVVSELQSMQMVGEGSLFERGSHVPVTHMAFFKPPPTAFLSELRAKDRRSAKEWEYINAAEVWLELGQAAMSLTRASDETMIANTAEMARMLALADKAFSAAREVLAMRGQYFSDIVQYGVEAARQMSFIVEQGHDAIHSTSHKSARESLSLKIESEAAKMLAKAHLERAAGGSGAGGAGSGSGAGGAAADA